MAPIVIMGHQSLRKRADDPRKTAENPLSPSKFTASAFSLARCKLRTNLLEKSASERRSSCVLWEQDALIGAAGS